MMVVHPTEEIEMKIHNVIIGGAFALVGTVAQAAGVVVEGEVLSVQPRYQVINHSVPVQSCTDVQVPVYSSVNTTTPGDIIGGAIIGSIIGNNIKGEQNGGTAGAVIGGMIAGAAGNRQQIVGYQTRKQCQTTYQNRQEQVVSGYQILVEVEDRRMNFETNVKYNIGDKITIRKNVRYGL